LSEARSLKDILGRRKALFEKKPEAAQYRPSVVTEWKGGLLNENRIRDHKVACDYPVPSGGTDQAPNPMELVLAALGSCVSAVFVEYAAMLDIQLRSVKVELGGEIDLRGLFNVAPVPSGFSSISCKVTLQTDADKEKVEKLVELAQAHCPVSESLKLPVDVRSQVAIEPLV